jgi:hydrogenase maturation protease
VNNTSDKTQANILVIGYGNDLRSDDGIGQHIAKVVSQWNQVGVRSLWVHQLTPELASDITTAKLVIFVDAYRAFQTQDVQVRFLAPVCRDIIDTHNSDPPGLLKLAQSVYGHCPPAWLIAVPGVNFELGESFSPTTKKGLNQALEQIANLLETH